MWPVSRQAYPKQFSNILGVHSLFQNTVELFYDHRFELPLILTNNDYRFIVEDQLNKKSINNSGIIIEPAHRDTAPAILAAALILKRISENPNLLILPSDHIFGNKVGLKSLIYQNSNLLEEGDIITFGIKPTRIETGYGWIEASKNRNGNNGLSRVLSFHEKPNKKLAEQFYRQGNFLWNSGVYLFSAETIIDTYNKHSPQLTSLVKDSVKNSRRDLNFIRLEEKTWDDIKTISVDYAIMEKASNLLVAKYEYAWDDLGDWNAVWRENEKDQNGVVSLGSVFTSNCRDSYFRSENPNQQLVALGCKNMVVVSMPDAVLVSSKDQVQEVKEAIYQLFEKGRSQSWKFPIENRFWGNFETLFSEDSVQINRLIIQPGNKILLQRHNLRTENWVILKGEAQITLGTELLTLAENQSINIPKGTKHSIQNSTDQPLIVLEIQLGFNFTKEDIERFDCPEEK